MRKLLLIIICFGLVSVSPGAVKADYLIGLVLDFPAGSLDDVTRLDLYINSAPDLYTDMNCNDVCPGYKNIPQYIHYVANELGTTYYGEDFPGALGLDWNRNDWSGGKVSYYGGVDTMQPGVVDGYYYQYRPQATDVKLTGYFGKTKFTYFDTGQVVTYWAGWIPVKLNVWEIVVEPDEDLIAPVITLIGQADVNVVRDSVFNDAGATANDDEEGDITDEIIVGGDFVNTAVPGTYVITYDVADSSGNEAAQVVRRVHVADNPPAISVIGNNPFELTVNTVFIDPGATAIDDHDGNLTASIIVSGSVDNSKLGNYVISYDVTDSWGNVAATKTRKISVVADKKPVITLIGEEEITVIRDSEYNDPGATASDFEDGILTGEITIAGIGEVDTSIVGDYEITYNVSDSALNAADQVLRTVHVVDNPPVITLLGNSVMDITINSTFTDPGATATDDHDGNISGKIIVGGDNVKTATLGTYRITYDVSDEFGNNAVQIVRAVNVVEAPKASEGGGGGGCFISSLAAL